MNDKKVPSENRILLGSVLQMLHDAFSKHGTKRIEESRSMASTLDSLICPVHSDVKDEMKTAKAEQFPVLRHMIEGWGSAVTFDSNYNFIDTWDKVYEYCLY